jgi:hypothetical protein
MDGRFAMKKKNNCKTLFLELAGLLVLGISLVFILNKIKVNNNGKEGQTNLYSQPEILTGTLPAYPGPGEWNNLTPTINSVKPPKCNFINSTLPNESLPNDIREYTFSQPKVILTSETLLGIVGWLPDNNRILLTEDSFMGTQKIFSYDISTGNIQEYAERSISSTSSKPIWIDELSAVVFTDRANPNEGLGIKEDLRISYGDPQSIKILVPDIYGGSLSSNGNELAFFSPSKGGWTQVWSVDSMGVRSLLLDMAEWTYPKYNEMTVQEPGRVLRTAFQPKGTKIIFYGAWLFLVKSLDINICEIEIQSMDGGILGYRVKWSPDGQSVAVLIGESLNKSPVSHSLAIINMITGNISRPVMNLININDFEWSPDSQNIAVLGNNSKGNLANLFINNIYKDKIQNILPEQLLGGGEEGRQLAWSNDNRFIAIKCTLQNEGGQGIMQDRVCLIETMQ